MSTTAEQIQAFFPACHPGRYNLEGLPGYEELLTSGTTWQVVVSESVGDYQGDTYALIRDGKRYGFQVWGYGSCSGCDALEGAETMAELAALRDSLQGDITWFDDAAGALVYFQTKDWELERCYDRDHAEKFIRESVAALSGDLAA